MLAHVFKIQNSSEVLFFFHALMCLEGLMGCKKVSVSRSYGAEMRVALVY